MKHTRWVGVAVAALLILSVALVSGCGKEEPTATPRAPEATATSQPSATQPPATSATQAPGGLKSVPRNRTLIIIVSEAGTGGHNPNYANMNLFIDPSWGGWHTGPLQTMNEPLIMSNVIKGTYEPWLAESWKYNTANTELTVKLRAGITWSDGKPYTARDVAYTFNTLKAHPKMGSNRADVDKMKEAVVVDDLTVKFIFDKPTPLFYATTLSSNHGVVEQTLPEHVFKDKDPETFNFFDLSKGWPIATGPFKVVAASPEQEIYDRVATCNDWWACRTGFKPLPEVERVIYLANRDESAAATMLINGEVDMLGHTTVPTIKAIMAKNPKVTNFDEKVLGFVDWCPLAIGFNSSEPPFNDKDIRFAVNFAIDRDKLIDVAEQGSNYPALDMFTPYDWFKPFHDELKPILAKNAIDTKAHLDKTTAIMTSKGYTKDGSGLWTKDGKHVVINFWLPESWPQWGPPLTQQLRDGGFDASFDITPGKFSDMSKGTMSYFICRGASGVKGQDPWYMLNFYTSASFKPTGEEGGWGPHRWRNAEYDKLVDEIALYSPDDPKTMENFKKAMEIWTSEMPDIFLAQIISRGPRSTQYWTNWPTKDNVHGFPINQQQEFFKSVIALKKTQ